MKHYLMIKTHNQTGLKYLCKTTTDDPSHPFSYKGSGKYWKRHLNTHGSDITTEIVGEYDDKNAFIRQATLLSEQHNVDKSDEWANLRPERGDGGPTMSGVKMTNIQNEKKSKALQTFYKECGDEYMKERNEWNSKSHQKWIYHTPKGTFTNIHKAAEANECSFGSMINKCKDNDRPLNSRKIWHLRGKTWRELGWSRESINKLSV